MDYRLNVYTSSEKEMLNVVSNNPTKQIKTVSKQKLQAVYKKYFGAAVKRYDEYAITGKLIGNYYKAILNSNIPEVYELSLIIKYELQNKTDLDTIKKLFSEFKKTLDKRDDIAIVSVFHMNYDEFKELVIYFVPVSEGYMTGLTVRNDLIDVTRRMMGLEKEKMDITRAMPLFTKQMDEIFQELNNGQVMTQKELQEQARRSKEGDPNSTHTIEITTLQMQMNELQELNITNQEMTEAVNKEFARIQNDLVWAKQKEQEIIIAEQNRVENEKQAAIVAEKERVQKEAEDAQKAEEDRLRAEEAKIEQERFAEQARRNIEMRQAMNLEAEMAKEENIRLSWNADDFLDALKKHQEWVAEYNITEYETFKQIPENALADTRRMKLEHVDMTGISINDPIMVYGVEAKDCTFSDCIISINLFASSIDGLKSQNTVFNKVIFTGCILNNIDVSEMEIENVRFDKSAVAQINNIGTKITHMQVLNGTKFYKCNCSNAEFFECDMKQTVFTGCCFKDAMFDHCDVRNAIFNQCDTTNMKNNGSAFRGVQRK